MLAWSWPRDVEHSENYHNDKLLKLTFLKDNSNNKPNRWKRIRKKIQIRFLPPWSNPILKPLVSANNNKGSELMCVMEFCSEMSVKNSITVIGRTQ